MCEDIAPCCEKKCGTAVRGAVVCNCEEAEQRAISFRAREIGVCSVSEICFIAEAMNHLDIGQEAVQCADMCSRVHGSTAD